jgi:guanylate kinase
VSPSCVTIRSSMAKGELFILSAPSGTGKTTLIRGLMEGGLADFGGIVFAVSHTTRPPREGEVNGRDYHFVDHDRFQEMIDQDRFLEWAEVHNNRYGTARDEVLSRLEQGIDVLMDIDVQGADSVLSRSTDGGETLLGTEVHSIFLMPPSYADLEQRLCRRRLDDPEEIARRLAVASGEIKRYKQYRYVIVNDDAERASHVLASIILEKRHREARMHERVAGILTDFEECHRPG